MTKEATQSTQTVIKTVREVIRDTTVVIAADSASIRALLECDSAGNILMKALLDYKSGKYLKPPNLDIKDNILTASSYVDSIGIYLTFRDRYEEIYKDKTVEVNVLTRWQKVRLCIANWGLVIGLLWLFIKLKNKIRWVKRE